MAENPNITELDSDYEPKENSAVEINGALPGEGDGVSYWTKDADGNLVPAGGEPLSVGSATVNDDLSAGAISSPDTRSKQRPNRATGRNRSLATEARPPEPVLTWIFDDAYDDLYDNAYPVFDNKNRPIRNLCSREYCWQLRKGNVGPTP